MVYEKPKDLRRMGLQDTEVPTVYYDGSCPLCAKEISFYRTKEGADGIIWNDVANWTQGNLIPGLSRETVLRRFHVKTADGTILSGAAAFAHLWLNLPGWRLLGAMIGNRLVLPFAETAYRMFLLIRPAVQVLVRKAGDGQVPSSK